MTDTPLRPHVPSDEATTTYTAGNMGRHAIEDLLEGVAQRSLWLGLAVFDIRQRFRRSMIGPFWLTITTAVMLGALSLVFGTLFQQDLSDLVPYLGTGLILWGLMSSVVLEAGMAFISAEGFIRNVPMPVSVHVYRMIARNFIAWSFSIVIYIAIWLIFVRSLSWTYLLFFPGMLLLFGNLLWISFAVAILSARYRDIPQVVASVVQVVFFLTPVFWSIETLPTHPAFVSLNPIYHLLEIVRAPLLGEMPSAASWIWGIGMLVVGTPIALLLYRRAYARIPYWV